MAVLLVMNKTIADEMWRSASRAQKLRSGRARHPPTFAAMVSHSQFSQHQRSLMEKAHSLQREFSKIT